ncbi:MAG: thioredoxin domain-containing protein [Candidatus Omnitrophica bacterium]|nr:thioredoxin domain-containing protein [Candidatus Omnitrophota bacterium]
MKSKKTSTIFIIFVCIAVVFGIRYYQQKNTANLMDGPLTRAKGNPKAPIKIVEFIDYQCPACAMGSKYLKEKYEQYPDQLRIELKYFPLGMHQHAMLSAQYVECAARQGKLWPFQDKVMERQNGWKNLIDPRPAFDVMAKEIEIDLDQMKQCLDNEDVKRFILEDKEKGNSLGVKSTPTYFVNNKLLVGAKSLDIELKKLLGIKTD